MKSSLDHWRVRNSLALSEAALLITANNPDDWSNDKLLASPPAGFKAIYGQLCRDASIIVDEHVESEDYPGQYYTEYALLTDKPAKMERLTEMDGLSVSVGLIELKQWLKKNELNAAFFDDETLKAFESSSAKAYETVGMRERNTFLIIIAALAKEARIDVTSPSKAATVIENMTEHLGARVDKETIAGKLKEIPSALESRSK